MKVFQVVRISNLCLRISAVSRYMPIMSRRPPKKPEAIIKRALESSRQDVKVGKTVARRAKLTVCMPCTIENGPLVYAWHAGRQIFRGRRDLFQVQAQGFVNLGEQKRNGERAAKSLAAVKPSDMIIFKATERHESSGCNVFTDVDCGYCQKLHKEVLQQLSMRWVSKSVISHIRVSRRGFWRDLPEAGDRPGAQSDRQGTLTRYKNHENIPISTCANNPRGKAEFCAGKLHRRQSVHPALVTTSGELDSGLYAGAGIGAEIGRTLKVARVS